MIVREIGEDQLLCISQSSHALMSLQFCQHWGNQQFTRPEPFDVVMLAVAQHDNGWVEWESAPKLRADRYPMDFINEDDPGGKVDLWRRGMMRAYAQHPYAGILVGNHAVLLYESALNTSGLIADEGLRKKIQGFIDEHSRLIEQTRPDFAAIPSMQRALTPEAIERNTRYVQLGDTASLQVCMPWAKKHTIPDFPMNDTQTVDIEMEWGLTSDGPMIWFDPWPYHVDLFMVSIHGRLLSQRVFANEQRYHEALARAPYQQLEWQVMRQT
ncbi:MAG: DUF3891 family protein [Chloroflexota bacterium]